MGRPSDTISSKRGRNKLRSKSDMIVGRTLKLMDALYKDSMSDQGTPQQRKDALMLYIDILPFIRPKLSAIAPAELDQDGNMVTPAMHAAIIREIQSMDEGRPRLLDAVAVD